MVAALSGLGEGLWRGRGGIPDGRMGLLVGSREQRERGEADELALEGHVLLLPDAQDHVERFGKFGARRLQRGVPDLVLPAQEAGAHAEVEPALAEYVERGVVLGEPQGVM